MNVVLFMRPGYQEGQLIFLFEVVRTERGVSPGNLIFSFKKVLDPHPAFPWTFLNRPVHPVFHWTKNLLIYQIRDTLNPFIPGEPMKAR